MRIFTTPSKKTMAMIILAATGLPASMASAQFKAQYASAEPKERTIMVLQENENDHVYEIRIENGVVVSASIDGQELDTDQIKINGDVIVFLGKDGKALHELKMAHEPHKEGAPMHTTNRWKSIEGKNSVTINNQKFRVLDKEDFIKNGMGEFSIYSSRAPIDGTIVVRADIIQPKVMLGINLSEPSPALRKHLGLKDGVHAILVENVIDGLPASQAGLEDFDVIVSLDGSDQADGKLLGKLLAEKEPGDTLKLVVLRGGEKVKLKVKLEAYNAGALGIASYDRDARDGSMVTDEGLNLTLSADDDRPGLRLEQLKKKLGAQFGQSQDRRDIIEAMRKKAMNAMHDTERQIIEFRDGKLIVRSIQDRDGPRNGMRGRIHDEHDQEMDFGGARPHMNAIDEMDERLADLESRLDEQMNQLSEQMDRLADMFERLMNTLDDDED